MSDNETLYCSFCGKCSQEVKKLIAGPNVYICDECTTLCYNILTSGKESKNDGETALLDQKTVDENVPSPKKIKEYLDQYVIGQDDAKKTISIAVYNHYKRLHNPVVEDVELEKSNVLMIGPSGSGKTLIAQSVARILDVPLAIVDSTSLTEAGYVGEDVEAIIQKLLVSAGNNAKKAERGIVFIDEIDKKRGKNGANTSGGRDVSGEGVQQALLKLLEGSDVTVQAQGKRSDMVKINTRNILFIVGGAFVGLDKIVETSSSKNGGMGFFANAEDKKERNIKDLLSAVEPEHLIKYGMIPELIGRLPVYTSLEELSEEQLIQVLTEPKNSLIKQFEARFKLENIDLVFTRDALEKIAKISKKRKTGARGLRSVVENSLREQQYELPELKEKGITKIEVNADMIK